MEKKWQLLKYLGFKGLGFRVRGLVKYTKNRKNWEYIIAFRAF